MIVLQILICFGCGALNSAGGFHWLFCRRYLMPTLLTFDTAFIEFKNKDKGWWWKCLLILPLMGTLCLGYSKLGNWWRPVWVAIQATIISLGMVLTGHLTGEWITFSVYVGLAAVLGWFYIPWKQWLGDFVLGFYLGSIIFFVH